MRESDFPCAYKERYDSPGVFGPAKLRKLKSMQPKTDEEFDLAFKAKMMITLGLIPHMIIVV